MTEVTSASFPGKRVGTGRVPYPTPPPASRSNQWCAQTQLWAWARLSTDLLSHGGEVGRN